MSAESSKALVRRFADAWARCDIDAVIEMLAPDVVHENPPLQKIVGRDAVRASIAPNMVSAKSIPWKFLAIESDRTGSHVLCERIDTFVFSEGTVSVPLMGIFEIKEGLISKWRDYADLGSFLARMKAIGRSSHVEKRNESRS